LLFSDAITFAYSEEITECDCFSKKKKKTFHAVSDVARPLSYKTYFFKTKTTFSKQRPIFLMTIKLLTKDLKKRFLTEKKSSQWCQLCPVMPELFW